MNKIFTVLTIICLFSYASMAQTGCFRGVVMSTDSSKSRTYVIKGAVITLVQNGSNDSLSMVSDRKGSFRCNDVKRGKYAVFVNALGFNNVSFEEVDIRLDVVTELNINMEADEEYPSSKKHRKWSKLDH